MGTLFCAVAATLACTSPPPGSGTRDSDPAAPDTAASAAGEATPLPGDTAHLGRLSGEFHALPQQLSISFFSNSAGAGTPRYIGGIARNGAGQPDVGHYPLGLHFPDGSQGGFYFVYTFVRGDTSFAFVSTAGELVITASSANSVTGRFEERSDSCRPAAICRSGGVFFRDFLPADADVRVRFASERTVSRRVSPDYVPQYPNGRECGEVCRTGRVVIGTSIEPR